jgi:hypothetical protein
VQAFGGYTEGVAQAGDLRAAMERYTATVRGGGLAALL